MSDQDLFTTTYRVLLEAYRTPETLAIMLRLRLSKNLIQISTASGMRNQIFDVVTAAESEGWLLELLQATRTDLAEQAPRHSTRESAPPSATAPSAVAASPFTACWLNGETVFVGREVLRGTLRDIDATRNRPVLMVKGDRCVGKSYTYELIKYAADQLDHRRLWIDLREALLPGEGPAELARVILDRMGVASESLPEQGNSTDERWVMRLRDVVMGRLRNVTGTWWIVLDGFDRATLDPNVYRFLVRLAAETAMTLPQLRIILLGYDEHPPPEMKGRMRLEEITPIGESDLVEFFRCVFQEQGVRATQAVLQATVRQIAPLLPNNEERLSRMNELVCTALHELFKEDKAQ